MNKAQVCGLQCVSFLKATYISTGFVVSKPRLGKPDLAEGMWSGCPIVALSDGASKVPVVCKGEFDRLRGRVGAS